MTSSWADSESSVEEIGVLADEFLSLLRQGLNPQLEDYCQRYPELAAKIKDLFPTLLMMEQCGEVTGDALFDTKVRAGSPYEQKNIGDFQIIREIGRGGMGIVYEAEQQSLGRRVALKVLPPSASTSKSASERFRRESRSAARLHHSNIVPVFGVGEHEGLHYYVMQYIDGVGLDKVLVQLDRSQRPLVFKPFNRVDRPTTVLTQEQVALAASALRPDVGGLEKGIGSVKPGEDVPSGSGGNISSNSSDRIYWRHVATIGFQLAGALHFAHTQGVLHRDVKPANVLLDRDGTAWLTDFGLAQATEDTNLTRSGDIVGTLRYLAPERLKGECSPQSDVYGLGITLFELVTLSPAFPDSDRAALIKQIVQQDPKRPRAINPNIPRDLETIVLKAIAKEPVSRYRNAEELADDLSRFLRDLPIQARRAVLSEKIWRWCRRNPIVATLGAAVGILTIALLFGWGMFSLVQADRDKARQAEMAAEQARASAARAETVALAQTQLALASGLRKSDGVFRKSRSLEAINAAISFSPPEGITNELRNEAIASLVLADLKPGRLYDFHPEDHSIRSFSADLSRYATLDFGGRKNVVWDTESQKALLTFDFPSQDYLLLSRDGRFVAVCDERQGGTLNVWDVDRGVQTLGPIQDCWCFDFWGNDKLVVGSDQGDAKYFSLADGQELRRQKIPCVPNSLRISPDGKLLALSSNSENRRLFVVDSYSGDVKAELLSKGKITDCDWHPDSCRIALACSAPDDAEIWNTKTCKQCSVLVAHSSYIQQIAFSESGDVCTTASWDGTVRFWESDTGEPIGALTSGGFLQRGNNEVIALQFVKEGQREVKLDRPHGFKRVAAGNKQPQDIYFGGQAAMNGRLLATATSAGVKLWDLDGPSVVAELPGAPAVAVSIDPEKEELIWAEAGIGLFRSSIEHVDASWRFRPRSRWVEPVIDRAVTTPDRRFWGLIGNEKVQILDSSGKTLSQFDAPGDDSLFLSPDGRFCATGQWHSLEVSLWDTFTGQLLTTRSAPQSTSAFTPDSREWILGTSDEYKFFDLSSLKVTRRIPRVDCAFAGPIAFSPCGKLAAMETHWGMIDLVRTDNYHLLARLECPHRGGGSSMEFIGQNSTLCVFHAFNREFHIWKLDELRQRLKEMGLDWQDGQPNTAFVRPVQESPQDAFPKKITVVDQEPKVADPVLAARNAIAAAEAGFANDPSSAYAANSLAWNLVICPEELRDAQRAVRLMEDLQLREKLNVNGRNTLATAYFRSERFDDAIQVYRENLNLQNDESLGYDLYPLAMCYWKLGDQDRAREILEWAERLFRLKPEPPFVGEFRLLRDEAMTLIRGVKESQMLGNPSPLK